MNNPLPTFMMIGAYLSWVLVIGPLYMRDRKPMNINKTIIIYNAFQVLLSAYMFYEVSANWPSIDKREAFKSVSLLIRLLLKFNSIWLPVGGEITAWAVNQLITAIRHSQEG